MDVRRAAGQPEPRVAWAGPITWQTTPQLREALFDALEVPGHVGVRVDVREVTTIDRSGVALLIGANQRARSLGRLLILIDNGGPVTTTLAAMHLLHLFHVRLVVVNPERPRTESVSADGGSAEDS